MSSGLDAILGGSTAPTPTISVPGSPPGPDGGGGTPGSPDNASAAQALSEAIDAVARYLEAESDPVDKATASRCLAQLHGLMGGRAKDEDAAMGTTPQHRFLRRQSA